MKSTLPAHVGFIPDGNRCWALSHGLPKEAGYAHGIAPGFALYEACKSLGTPRSRCMDTDKDFAMMMKMHHQGAIDMAQAELKNGKDEKLRKMAKKIIEAQQKEIKEFDQWLAKRK